MEQFEPERLHRLEPGQHGVFAGPPPLVGAGLDLNLYVVAAALVDQLGALGQLRTQLEL